ncbi:hypothetical protein ABEB36_008777 [Hypothenemus hampei]|uniref:Uncharacterized protein n=1 Tax=Hypothenemus hampei TaxID=57062 RepID=A0ABD1EN15_HYPHA
MSCVKERRRRRIETTPENYHLGKKAVNPKDLTKRYLSGNCAFILWLIILEARFFITVNKHLVLEIHSWTLPHKFLLELLLRELKGAITGRFSINFLLFCHSADLIPFVILELSFLPIYALCIPSEMINRVVYKIDMSLAELMAKNLNKITFRIIPSKGHLGKLNVSQLKRIPKPPEIILENPWFQENIRRHARNIQKTIELIQINENKKNEFPKAEDYPDDLM